VIEPQSTVVSNTTKFAATTQIVEASGWVRDRTGNIQLVAQAPHPTPHNPWHPAACQFLCYFGFDFDLPTLWKYFHNVNN
jgi:hypothetical protein